MCKINQFIEFTETTWNTAENRRENVAKWTLATHPGANYIIFQRETATTKPGDKIKKAVRVKPDEEFTFKLMKTRINAKNGAAGLFEYMFQCLDKNFCVSNVYKICNYAWTTCKEY